MLLPTPWGPALSRFPTEQAAAPDLLKWPRVEGCVLGMMLSPAQGGRQPDWGFPKKTQGHPVPNDPRCPGPPCSLQLGACGVWGLPATPSQVLLTWEHLRAAQASILPAWQPPIRGGSAVALETLVAITAADGGTGEADGGRGGQPWLAGRDGGLHTQSPPWGGCQPPPRSPPGPQHSRWRDGNASSPAGVDTHLGVAAGFAICTGPPHTLSHPPCCLQPQATVPVPRFQKRSCQASPIPGTTPGQPSQPRPLAPRSPTLGEMPKSRSAYLDLSLAHDLVHDFIVVLVELGLVVALLVAEDAQGLGALQLDLKLLGCGGRVASAPAPQSSFKAGAGRERGAQSPLCIPPSSHLVPLRLSGVPKNPGLGFADEVAKGVHLQRAVKV